MALSLRQSYQGNNTNSIASISVVAGDLIIVGRVYGQEALATDVCSDNAAGGTNTYNLAETISSDYTVTNARVFYAIAKATETLTITCTARTYQYLVVHVVSGANQNLGSVLDVVATSYNSLNSNPYTTNTITTTNANDYLFSIWGQGYAAITSLTENGTGFTAQASVGNALYTFDRIVSGTGTYSESVTYNASTSYSVNILVAFKDAGNNFNAQRQSIINGIVSAQSETHGWNTDVKTAIPVANVVRTSDTVCTITLPAVASYSITANETITPTIPSTVLTGAQSLTSSSFTVTNDGGGAPPVNSNFFIFF